MAGGKVAVLMGGIKSSSGLASMSGSSRRTAALKLIPESGPTYPESVSRVQVLDTVWRPTILPTRVDHHASQVAVEVLNFFDNHSLLDSGGGSNVLRFCNSGLYGPCFRHGQWCRDANDIEL